MRQHAPPPAQPDLIERDGVLLIEWTDDEGVPRVEVADGGTTATVVALVDGASLVVAQVGDSTALLGGRLDDNEACSPPAAPRACGASAVRALQRVMGTCARRRRSRSLSPSTPRPTRRSTHA